MNLAEIETFLTIVNTKSITKTADLLFLSQPTVSHRLTTLENELGFSLVIRNKGHKVELTPKGILNQRNSSTRHCNQPHSSVHTGKTTKEYR